jgi:hypothetical protein
LRAYAPTAFDLRRLAVARRAAQGRSSAPTSSAKNQKLRIAKLMVVMAARDARPKVSTYWANRVAAEPIELKRTIMKSDSEIERDVKEEFNGTLILRH